MTIYIKIFAGLCNRLFQYAYGKHLISEGKKVKFIIADDGNTDILDIIDLYNENNLFISTRNNSNLRVFLAKFFAKYIAHSYEVGFYQNPDYIKGIKFFFKNKEQYENSKLYNTIIETDSVSLHIRGGDYVLTDNNCFSHICTPEYYDNAIKTIKSKIKNPKFIIFTNDRKYSDIILSQINLTDKEFIFASDIDDKKYDDGFDLYLMGQCKGNIIANSTFSWFGAYFNSANKKMVICPEHWYGNGDYSSDILLLPEWTKVKST